MKHLFYILLLSGYGCFSQNALVFSYDAAGNQIKRELICLTCDDPSGQRVANPELTKSKDYQDISYYPNPVVEELHIRWENTQETFVTGIEVYSFSGQQVGSAEQLSGVSETSVSFAQLASGMYAVILVYNDGTKKDLKVVKK
ncbi:MAG: hypothetical protein DI539_11515 [Flavobacterium psychrophilum]|nr:MAG: hypothetical protein DI539_11515 [Flavobacterium psychrophilum]